MTRPQGNTCGAMEWACAEREGREEPNCGHERASTYFARAGASHRRAHCDRASTPVLTPRTHADKCERLLHVCAIEVVCHLADQLLQNIIRGWLIEDALNRTQVRANVAALGIAIEKVIQAAAVNDTHIVCGLMWQPLVQLVQRHFAQILVVSA